MSSLSWRRLAPAALLALGLAAPALAQTSSVDQTFDRIEALQQQGAARQRAVNLARNTAVRLNGGLSRYMPAACMFASGAAVAPCLVKQSSGGFLFRFNGGAPGWQQLGQAPTTRTELRISADGRQVLEVVYNGPTR